MCLNVYISELNFFSPFEGMINDVQIQAEQARYRILCLHVLYHMDIHSINMSPVNCFWHLILDNTANAVDKCILYR